MKLALSIFGIALALATSAHAEKLPTPYSFYVVDFDGIRSETQFYVEDANDPVLAEKESMAKDYAKELQQQGSFLEGIELHVVRYTHCEDALCGKFLPVAGKYPNYKTASTACDFWKSKDIACKVVRIEQSLGSAEYNSLCRSVAKWCTQQAE